MLNDEGFEWKVGGRMSSFFDSGPLPNWKQMQEWLGRDMPWDLVEKWDKRRDNSWLNEYVKNMMVHARKDARAKSKGLQRMDVQKDAKFVTVTMKLESEQALRGLQLFANSERLRVTGLPNDGKQSIRFPCLVYPRTGKAAMKKDRLVVRFKRRPAERNEYELFIDP